SDRSAPMQCVRRPAAWRRLLPDAENFCGEVSFEPPSRFPSLDYLVGEREHFIGDRKAERFCSFEVDHQLELGWLHDWQVGWLLAFENAADVDADLTERVCHTGVVAH